MEWMRTRLGHASDFAGFGVGLDSGLSVPTPEMKESESESKFLIPNFSGTPTFFVKFIKMLNKVNNDSNALKSF